ncbi:MAG: phosphoribosylanthranilate isomerase [Sarcina sp.]
MILKICGIKSKEEILALNRVKCDFAGFIMTESKRKISFEIYDEIIKKLDCRIQKVAVFKDDDLSLVKKFVKMHDVDIIQLHGKEDLMYIKNLDFKRTWKVLCGNENLEQDINKFKGKVERILVDSAIGGSGKIFNWDILKNIDTKELIIAGGINIENISDLVKINEFYGVDISSGVEKGGLKNLKLMQKLSSFVYKK